MSFLWRWRRRSSTARLGASAAQTPGRAWGQKPGSTSHPFLGVEPAIVNEQGEELEGEVSGGYLVIKRPWPSIMRTIYGDHQRFLVS